jgi:hypothetical protein
MRPYISAYWNYHHRITGSSNDSPADGPMLTVDFTLRGHSLKMFSTLSQFGTALDAGKEELLIESYFPADEQCRAFFQQFTN